MKKSGICEVVLAAAALSVLAAGCIAWTEDPKGNLQSVGLPGLPVWTAQKPSPQAPLPAAQSAADELARDDTGGAPWLDELNRWRQAAGLQPVGENLLLSDGSAAHAHYLLQNARIGGSSLVASALSMGASMHSESPGSPAYSDQGAEAAVGGRHVPGVVQTADIAWAAKNSKADIDSLLIMPFHRLSLLAPWAEVAGYGKAGKFPDRVGALALRGRHGRDANILVKFPPAGTTVPFASMSGREWPNPLTACPGYQFPVGLPVTLQLVKSANLGTSSIKDLTAGRELAACAFDAESYGNPDATQETYARRALTASRAIVLIPRYPLQAGHQYQVSVQAGTAYEWTFNVGEPENEVATTRSAWK